MVTDASWLPLADTLDQAGQVPENSAQALAVDRARLAAAAYVERVRPDLIVVDALGAVTFVANPDVIYGAQLLAARWYARKASPAGLASFGEFGPAAVVRLDPDVERLLGLGRNARPVIG